MRLPLDWVRDLIELPESPAAVAERLDLTGTAVEAVERDAPGLENVVVGKVLAVAKHPNADRLTYDQVDVGTHVANIVCGADNVVEGMTVPVALPGAVLPTGMAIERRAVRGLDSEGMMCAPDELGLGADHSGIMVLDDTSAPGTALADALGLGSPVLDLEITPNRPDCLSIKGLARELGAVFERRVDYSSTEPGFVPGRSAADAASQAAALVAADAASAEDLVRVDIEDPEGCPRYVAMVIEGLTVGPSPEWMQQRLHAMGARPINNLVDITNYVMFELGQPLHAFDYDKIAEQAGDEARTSSDERAHIIVRRAFPDEKLATLDGVDRELTDDMLVITDPSGPVALAGVMGGLTSEVSETTTRVLLESANFHPPSISRTSRGLGLISESSNRFEKGVDAQGCLGAARRAATLMAELAQGRVCPGAVDAYPRPVEPRTLTLRPSRVHTILGMDPGEKTMADVLNRLGCATTLTTDAARGALLAVEVPTFRPDLQREIDLIEEVARLVGYSEIPSTMPGGGRAGGLTRPQMVEREIRTLIRAAGMNEAVSMGFVDPAEIAALRWPMPARGAVTLMNPLGADQSALRPTPLIELMRAVRRNLAVQERQIALFELGRAWPGDAEGDMPFEEPRLAIVMSGGWLGREWHTEATPFDVYDLLGVLEQLRDGLRLVGYEVAVAEHPSLMPGQSMVVRAGGVPLGIAGAVHPDVAEAFGIEERVFCAELSVDALVGGATRAAEYVPAPRFPAVERDLAVIVGAEVLVGELVATARAAGEPLLADVGVFDVYRGKGIAPDKKSVALGLKYRHRERTLTDAEVDEVHAQVERSLADAHGAVRR